MEDSPSEAVLVGGIDYDPEEGDRDEDGDQQKDQPEAEQDYKDIGDEPAESRHDRRSAALGDLLPCEIQQEAESAIDRLRILEGLSNVGLEKDNVRTLPVALVV